MLPFLLLTALVLSVLLLADLVGGLRRSETSEREQWQRAMSALSAPRPDDDAPRSGAAPVDRYGLAA